MGRIKTVLVKRTTKELIAKYMDDFKEDFEVNKKLVSKYMSIPSKKMRNIIAGYATRLVKNKETL